MLRCSRLAYSKHVQMNSYRTNIPNTVSRLREQSHNNRSHDIFKMMSFSVNIMGFVLKFVISRNFVLMNAGVGSGFPYTAPKMKLFDQALSFHKCRQIISNIFQQANPGRHSTFNSTLSPSQGTQSLQVILQGLAIISPSGPATGQTCFSRNIDMRVIYE